MVLKFEQEPCTYVRLAREREERNQNELLDRGYFFADNMADRVVDFFRLLVHWKGEWAGEPFELADWQVHDILRPLFGWYREDGTRRFRQAYIEIPKKNGKTALAAGIGVYLTVADGEPGSEVFSAATKKDQARLCHGDATEMVRRSPLLRNYVRIMRDSLSVQRTASKFEPVASDQDTLDGLGPHGVIVDEIHRHRTRGVWDVLTKGQAARRQPLAVAITTAGEYRPDSIGWELHNHAELVLNGALQDDSFFAYIAAADEGDDWRKPSTWQKANPNLGVSVKEETLREAAEAAGRSPQALTSFLRFNLNRWVAAAEGHVNMELWNKSDQEPPLTPPQVKRINRLRLSPGGTLDQIHRTALSGHEAYGGLDLSSTRDLTAFVGVFPDGHGDIDLLCRFWCPEETILQRAKEDNAPYHEWERDGWLIATPGNVVDYAYILSELADIADEYDLIDVGFDRWGMSKLQHELTEIGLNIVETGQGFQSMSAPMKETEKLYLSGKLHHAGHPVLRWNAGNVVATEDPAGNIKPDKKKSRGRIDGYVATIMAVDRWIRNLEDGDIYPEEGLTVLGANQ